MRRSLMVSLAALAVGGVVAVSSGPVAGQDIPTASATAACDGSTGQIQVSIVDDFSTTYDVIIDGATVASGITDTDGGVETFSPYDDGVHTVVVIWLAEQQTILDTEVTVDCEVPETTTTTVAATTTTTVAATTTTTVAATTTTTAAPTTAAPTTAAPTTVSGLLPATGTSSTTNLWLAVGGVTLIAAGSALLATRRRPG
jgi:LPXTG-motif cell wall-anchored protein